MSLFEQFQNKNTNWRYNFLYYDLDHDILWIPNLFNKLNKVKYVKP